MKQPKKKRRKEQMTVLVMSCDGKYALRKRGSKGLLAGLWEFPHVSGKLDAQQIMGAVETLGLIPADISRAVEKKHIFTHVEWDMRGAFLQVKGCDGPFTWLSAEQVEQSAALPTAFRQFREEIEHV